MMRYKFAINKFNSIATMKVWRMLVCDNGLRAVVHCHTNFIVSSVIAGLMALMHIPTHTRVYWIMLIMAVADHFVSNHTTDNAAGNEVDIAALPNDINKIYSAAVDTT